MLVTWIRMLVQYAVLQRSMRRLLGRFWLNLGDGEMKVLMRLLIHVVQIRLDRGHLVACLARSYEDATLHCVGDARFTATVS
jgi:hypothetical protein